MMTTSGTSRAGTHPDISPSGTVGAGTAPQNAGRRALLKLAAAGAPLVAMAGAAQAAPVEADAPVQDGVLRDTEHTRAYYAAARF